MINRSKPLSIFIILIFGNSAIAQSSISVRSGVAQSQQASPQAPNANNSAGSRNNNAQTQIEEAAAQFDSFALLMPKVLNAKLQSFLKHGFKAFLLEDPETKPAEEQMIDSLTKGLQALGGSLSADLANNPSRQNQPNQIPNKPSKQPE